MRKSFVLKLQVYKFFDDFVLIYPLYTLMFQDAGLSLGQISLLLLAWSLTAFALEVPSGVLADKYDRRSILILAQMFRIVGFLIWLLIPTFWGFLAGFIFWGIKSAFTSGTLDAYLYDGLKANGQEAHYAKVLGSLKAISAIAILLASALASALFKLGYSSILLLSIGSLFISVIALLLATSTKTAQSTHEADYWSLFKQGITNVSQNTKLLTLVLVGAIFVGALAVDEYFALYIDQVNIPVNLVGYLFATYSLIQAVASVIAYRFYALKALAFLLVAFSACFVLMAFAPAYLGILLFMLLGLTASFGQIISNTAIQNATKNQVRATVTSVSAFLAEVVAFVVYLIFLIVPSGQVKQGIAVLSVIVILLTVGIGALFFTKVNRRKVY